MKFSFTLILIIFSVSAFGQVPHISVLFFNESKKSFDLTTIQRGVDSTYEYVNNTNDKFYALDVNQNNFIIDSLNNRFHLNNENQLLDIHFQKELFVVTRENQSIYFIKSNDPNYSEHVSFYGMLILNNIPKKRGTYVISIGGDSKSPLFCPYPQNNKETDNWNSCISDKRSLLRDKIFDNKFYKSHFALEITKKGIIENRISNKVLTPQALVNFLNQDKSAKNLYTKIKKAVLLCR
ncbi:MAG: hypothetical protein Q8O62_01745 [Aequorivita sp.]|nr:hypothetical protein [Aequorivita sp.]